MAGGFTHDEKTAIDEGDSYGSTLPGPSPSNTPVVEPMRLTPAPILDRRRALEREQLASQVAQMRSAIGVGFFLWLGFALFDVIVVRYIEPGRLSFYFALRAVGALVIAGVLWRLRREPAPSRIALRALDLLVYTAASIVVGMLCWEFRGLESPYCAGLAVVLVCHTLTMSDHWKRNVILLGVPTLAFPLAVLAGALFVPSVAAQLHSARAVGTFVLYLFLDASVCLFMIVGGHRMWALKQQILEMRSVGRYRLKQRIGRGGMGEVWSAWDETVKRDVAVKILRPDAAGDAMAVARFEREVQATTELKHPNTVRVFDYGTTAEGHWYYVMELLEGLDLAQLVANEGPLAAPRAVHLVQQAARALAEAHRRGIVHRDIKPENLFVTSLAGEADHLKVVDFGIARILDGERSVTLTAEGGTPGTPDYMDPAVIQGEPGDARSDVYALGAVLYYLLAGAPPFVGRNVAAVMYNHVNLQPEPPSQRRGSPLPPEVEAIVMRCLQKRPADRYETAAELADALATCVSTLP